MSCASRTGQPLGFGGAICLRALMAFLVVGFAITHVGAQSATGNIAGYVKDTSGAAIPNVTVTAKMVEQQTTRTVQTNAEGFYTCWRSRLETMK